MTFEWKHPKHYAKLKKDFREEAEKEKKELDFSYKESVRQAKERKELDKKKKV
tara:strand:+ start:126 stop:284 length:159 start_codon:yes stop_codon:yes gene_type:complete